MAWAIDVASDVLFHLTARMFPGVCADRVRPTCAGNVTDGIIPWRTDTEFRDRRDAIDAQKALGLPLVMLPGFPVISITSVKVDAATLAASSYLIMDDKYLARVDGQGWPCSQDFAKVATQQGFFEVVYSFGAEPPPAGRMAATLLACEILQACTPGGKCSLPERTTQIIRQGVTVQMSDPNDFIENGRTGIPQIDLFIKTVNPNGLHEQMMVMSPDVWPVAHRFR